MTIRHVFAERVRAREPLTGGLLRMPNEQLAELSGLAGMDFIIIDCEHGGADQLALQQHITAAACGGAASIVRVGSDSEILRALDLGAEGILVPHVSDVARAQEIVSLMHYPPAGSRGFAPYTRAARYGLIGRGEYFRRSQNEVALFLMIEDQSGLENRTALANVDGVDGLMLGPADFTVENGLDPGASHPSVKEAALQVRSVTKDSGRACIEIVGSAESARDIRAAGAQMIVCNVQESLTKLMQQLVRAASHESL